MKRLAVLVICLLICGVGLAQTATPANTNETNTAQRSGRGGAYDQQIQKEVTDELKKHDNLKNVRATVEDGIVTLQGNVDLFSAKDEAFRKIRNKEHVQGVRNQIAVAGKQVPDPELREKLADKLRYDRIDQGITFNNFNLAVQNGIVTISGQARTPTDAASALSIVENTPGVRDVVDNIDVLPASTFDDDIRVRVARAIYGDPVMQKYAIDPQAPIRIVVDRGKVTLYGMVQSPGDKQIAEMRARQVPNVFSVTNNLAVAGQEAQSRVK